MAFRRTVLLSVHDLANERKNRRIELIWPLHRSKMTDTTKELQTGLGNILGQVLGVFPRYELIELSV